MDDAETEIATASSGGSLWSSFTSTIRGIDSPGQLGWGLILGLVIGLVPKITVIPAFLLIVLVLSRANLLTGLFGIAVGIVVQPSLIQYFDRVGTSILGHPACQRFFVDIHQIPGVAWLRLSNTVVMGGLVFCVVGALIAFLPINLFFAKFQPWLKRQFGSSKWTRWVLRPNH